MIKNSKLKYINMKQDINSSIEINENEDNKDINAEIIWNSSNILSIIYKDNSVINTFLEFLWKKEEPTNMMKLLSEARQNNRQTYNKAE